MQAMSPEVTSTARNIQIALVVDTGECSAPGWLAGMLARMLVGMLAGNSA